MADCQMTSAAEQSSRWGRGSDTGAPGSQALQTPQCLQKYEREVGGERQTRGKGDEGVRLLGAGAADGRRLMRSELGVC